MSYVECPEKSCISCFATQIRDAGRNIEMTLELAGLVKGATKLDNLLYHEGLLARDLRFAIDKDKTTHHPYDQFRFDFRQVEELRLPEDTIQDCEGRNSGICTYFAEGLDLIRKSKHLSEVLSRNNPRVESVTEYSDLVLYSLRHPRCPYVADIFTIELPLVGVAGISFMVIRHDPPKSLVPGITHKRII